MLRRVAVSLLLILLLVPGVVAMAMEHDHSWQENGDTYVGIFHVKDLPAADLERWKTIVTSPRIFAEEDESRKIYFMEVPEGVKGKIVKNPPGDSFAFNVRFSPSFTIKGMVFEYSTITGMYEYVGRYDYANFSGFGLDAVIVNRGFELTSAVPASELYIQHPGNLYLVDDLGNEMKGDGDADDGEPWWRHLLDWLDSFWKKLKDFFVPEDGYFDDWFQEIKDAAMEKLGPVKSMMDSLSNAFKKLQSDTTNTSIFIDVPEGQYWPGSPGIKVDVLHFGEGVINTVRNWLTAIIVVFTIICCYRRVVVLFEQ